MNGTWPWLKTLARLACMAGAICLPTGPIMPVKTVTVLAVASLWTFQAQAGKDDEDDKDKSDEDKSDEDKSDKDKSDEDKSDEDKSDKDKSDKDAGEKSRRKATSAPTGMVQICHKMGSSSTSKYKDLTVDSSALSAHLAHGDYEGVCTTSDTLTEQVIGCKEPYQTTMINLLRDVQEAQQDGGETGDLGLTGGHFDLDTATQLYSPNSGTTNKHVHQWDDKHNLTTVNFFNMLDSGFNNLQATLSPDQKFVLTVANAELSQGGVLAINGTSVNVVDYRQQIAAAQTGNTPLTVYKLGTPTDAEVADGVRQLTSLTLTFDVNAILNGGLIPTNTGCVRSNKPGTNNAYRNGALLVQTLDAATYALDATLGHATDGLKWEASLFWHWDPGECYGDATWQTVYDQCLVDGSCLSPSRTRGTTSSHASSQRKTTPGDAAYDADYDKNSFDKSGKDSKLCICHNPPGNPGKKIKIEVGASAACAHLGQEPKTNPPAGSTPDMASYYITPNTCTAGGHSGDSLVGWANQVDCKTKSTTVCSGSTSLNRDRTPEELTEEQAQAISDCLDPTKGGGYLGYMGGGTTGRVNWRRVVNE